MADLPDGFGRALRELLRWSHTLNVGDLPGLFDRVVAPLELRPTIYLIDYEQRTLRPFQSQRNGEVGQPVPVEGSLAGRAFATIEIQVSARPAALWIPILDGTTRLGVLRFALPDHLSPDDLAVRDGCLGLTSLVGHLLEGKSRLGDSVEAVRRSTPMTVASELLWDLVPPTTFACEQLVLAAVLEPCYDVGGDGFDYSVDGPTAHLSILDALGHGLPAAVTCCVALSALRAGRHRGDDLGAVAKLADVEITGQWSDLRFATAVLAELRLDTGILRYINAGHPPPVLVRRGRVVRLLDGARRLPLGLEDDAPEPAEEALEPGDRLLFYTDGVTEARDEEGNLFGLDRLVEQTERHAASGMPTPEVLRRLSHAVLDHQNGVLQDDATLLLAEWSRTAVARTLPREELEAAVMPAPGSAGLG
jgi:Stage II sporulation protein E (SpoIIE)